MAESETRAQRIMQRADQVASNSAVQGNITRVYLSAEQRTTHELLEKWMQKAGLETWQDSVGNLWGRKVAPHPTLPTLIVGSHSDTVINAGKYDGILGILLAIEAVDALRGHDLPFHVDVVAFADEEGTRFNTGLIGSSAVAGCFNPAWLELKDGNGVTVADAMHHFGLLPAFAGSDHRQSKDVLAYLEVHIEQGPQLEEQDRAVGVVTGVAGAKRYQFTLAGQAGHAGTVPVTMRRDALCGAAEMILAIEGYAVEHQLVATVGKCDTLPNTVNVIPQQVTFTLDIRSRSQALLEQSSTTLLEVLRSIAHRRNLHLEQDTLYEASAVPCSEALQHKWADCVEKETGQQAVYLPSAAGHDAMVMAQLADIGMLFVRSEKGISHHPQESVREQDVAIAVNCLTDMIKTLHL